jgi:CrcB protein
MIIWYIGLAGALGALSRYAVGLAIDPRLPVFPTATLLCNYTGSLALGWLTAGGAARLKLKETARAAVASGFIGSFTTFSTFSSEMLELFYEGQAWKAIAYAVASFAGGLLLARLGERLAARGGTGGALK